MKKRARKMHKTTTVEERDAVLLNALRKLGAGWHDRRSIAKALGKTKLSPADTLALEVLQRQGVVEIGMAPTGLITVSKWQYRIK